MNPALRIETARLTRSWARHDPAMLRDYLVASVEDPRFNAQSILTRHFLTRAVAGPRFDALANEEYSFSAAMNWLLELASRGGGAEEFAAVEHALRLGADNAEGTLLPGHVRRTYARLAGGGTPGGVRNYIEIVLRETAWDQRRPQLPETALNAFQEVWSQALAPLEPRRLRVLEPACGSANDYRFLDAYGIARLIRYSGFDLCPANVENARGLFPAADFSMGNVFEIGLPDRSCDLVFFHDLLEHLSPEGIDAAVKEVCRVCRSGLCLHFFNMDQIADDAIQPYEEYHWNLLSLDATRDRFAREGFEARAIHIGSFLREVAGAEWTHNPNAHTLLLWRPNTPGPRD